MHKLDLGNDKPGGLLARMALPAIISMVVNGLYYLVDAAFVGWGVGSRALAGLAVIFPLQMLMIAIGSMIGMGGASIISRRLGAGENAAAGRAAMNAVSLSLLFGLVLTGLTIAIQRPLLFALGATDYNLQAAGDYLGFIQLGFVFVFLSMTGFNIARAEGNAKAAAFGMLLGTALNLILDPLFIFTFKMGVGGAALATVIARLLSTLYFTRLLKRNKNRVRIDLRALNLDPAVSRNLLFLGLGNFLGQFCLSLLAVVMNLSLRRYGSDIDLAVYGVLSRIHVFITMPLLGLAQGFQPIAGFAAGAGNVARVRKVTLRALTASLAIGAALFVLTAFFPTSVMGLFSSDSALILGGSGPLRITMILLPVIGFQVIGFSLFQALGDAAKTLLLCLSRQFLILVPLLLVLPRFWGVDGLWYAYPLADGLAALLSLLLMQKAWNSRRSAGLTPAAESA
jgi:putative MATE family efflux protein